MAKVKTPVSIMSVSPERLHQRGHRFELKANGEGMGAFVTVVGPESPQVKAFMRAKVNERIRAEASQESPVTTVEELEAGAIERAIAYTIGWDGIVLEDGQDELPFTDENAKIVYGQAFIRSQVLQAAEDEGNFKPA